MVPTESQPDAHSSSQEEETEKLAGEQLPVKQVERKLPKPRPPTRQRGRGGQEGASVASALWEEALHPSELVRWSPAPRPHALAAPWAVREVEVVCAPGRGRPKQSGPSAGTAPAPAQHRRCGISHQKGLRGPGSHASGGPEREPVTRGPCWSLI